MKIDWELFPIKVHYFVRFIGTGPMLPFLPVIARQKGVSESMVGIIWTVLPFISLITKTSLGALADYLRAHRTIFMGGLIAMAGSFTAIYWTPDINTHALSSKAAINTQNMVDFDNNTKVFCSHLNTSQDDTNTHQDISNTTFRSGPFHDDEDFPTHEQAGINGSVNNENAVYGGHTLTRNSRVPNGSGCGSNTRGNEELSNMELLSRYEFWVLFLLLLLQFCAHITTVTMQETVCFHYLGENRHKYGDQRLWGTIGWGLAAIVGGALVDLYSQGQVKDYGPAHLIAVVFLMLDMIIVARLRYPSSMDKSSPAAIKEVLLRPLPILFLVSTAVIGASCGMMWTFELLLVEDVVQLWDPGFQHLKLLQGLSIGVQCFLSELPSMYLFGWIIKRTGHVLAYFIAFSGSCLRLCLYYAITNPWWFLPIGLFHGISFGLPYATFTSFANSITPKGAEATIQAIYGAAFFCATGVGSLVGGWLFSVMDGWRAFLTTGIFVGAYAGLFMVVYCIISRFCANENVKESQCEDEEQVPMRSPQPEV